MTKISVTSPVLSLTCQPENYWLVKQRILLSNVLNVLNKINNVCRQISSLFGKKGAIDPLKYDCGKYWKLLAAILRRLGWMYVRAYAYSFFAVDVAG